MADTVLRDNPDARPGASEPSTGWYPVDGSSLYAEVRGAGPPVLVIGAVSEDAEVFRPVAERLNGRTVVTYDQRGTLRSGAGAEGAHGSHRLATDAVELLEDLGLEDVVAFGASAGGIIALRAVTEYPERFRRALVYEPGCFRLLDEGRAMLEQTREVVERHLGAHPTDWAGAAAAMGRSAAPDAPPGSRGAFEPPKGKGWYGERFDPNAEAFIRRDIALTEEEPDRSAIQDCPVDIRFAHGTGSPPIFRDITGVLASLRGQEPEVVPGAGHSVYFTPGAVAEFICGYS